MTWARTGPDGSGEVTVNYDYVYGQGVLLDGAKEEVEEAKEVPEAKAHLLTRRELEARKAKAEAKPRRAQLVDQNFVFYPENLEPGSIKGWRAVAFVYSGKSGAPCLMAMVDKVDAGKSKRWAWQVPIDKEEKFGVKIEDRSFSLDHGEANMRATFVAPAKVVLPHNTKPITVISKGSAEKGTTMTATDWDRDQISATGEKGDEGLFIMVATFQKGKPPEVKVEGEGLAAVVTVGEQKIRFVGHRIVVSSP